MSRRIAALVASVLLAAVGGVVLLQYVAGADERAMAGLDTTTVLVAVQPIPAGTAVDELTGYVETRALPRVAVPETHVASLDEVAGLVTTTSIEVGEQLVSTRFADAGALANGAPVSLPKGMQQISVQLDRQRVLGGAITAGATVGVFISTDTETQLVLNRMLVTNVEGGLAAAETDGKAAAASGDTVLVTLAASSEQAEKIIYAAEHAAIWLSLQTGDSTGPDATTTTGKNLFR